jgi:hypothetical protein
MRQDPTGSSAEAGPAAPRTLQVSIRPAVETLNSPLNGWHGSAPGSSEPECGGMLAADENVVQHPIIARTSNAAFQSQ